MSNPKIQGNKMLIHRSLAAIVGILMLSHSMVMPASIAGEIAQQVPNNSPEYVKGKQLLDEARRLEQQGTGQSQQQAIALYEQALLIWRKIGNHIQEDDTLGRIAYRHYELSQFQKALEYYNQRLVITRQLKEPFLEANTLVLRGNTYWRLGENQKALQDFNQALSFFQTNKKLDSAAGALEGIANVYLVFGEKQKALNAYNQELEIYRTRKDTASQASILSRIAILYQKLGEYQKALPFLNQALEIQSRRNDINEEGNIYSQIGSIYYTLGENQQALKILNKALKLQQQAQGNLSGDALHFNLVRQALTYTSLAATYKSLGDYSEAISYYNSGRSLLQKIGDIQNEAGVLYDLSVIHDQLGDEQKALEYLHEALVIEQESHDPKQEAFMRAAMGSIYQSFGDYQKALDTYNQALILQRQVGDRSGEASTLRSFGEVYSLLGDYQLSLDKYNQALKISQTIGDRTQEGMNFNNIGQVYRFKEKYPESLEYYDKALKLWHEQKSVLYEISTLSNEIPVYRLLKNYPKALDNANRILSLSRQQKILESEITAYALMGSIYLTSGDYQKSLDMSLKASSRYDELGLSLGKVNTLHNIGKAYNLLNQPDKAIKIFNQQSSLQQKLGNRTGHADALYNIAVIERDRNNLEAAKTQIESVIGIVEDIRTQVTSQDLRSSYFASVQSYYKFYIDLLMRLHKKDPSHGYDAQALHISEQSRARILTELLTEAHADIRKDVDPKLLAEEQHLQQLIDSQEKLPQELSNKPNTDAAIAKLKQDVENLLSQQKELKTKIRNTSPKFAALKYPDPLELPQIQQQLDQDTLLLEYSLGEEHSYLWAVTPNSINTYELSGREAITKSAETFKDHLLGKCQKPGKICQKLSAEQETAQAATEISKLILAPVVGKLGKKRLVIVADGALQTIPFAALSEIIPNNNKASGDVEYQPLIVNHEIVNLPSVTTIATQRQELNGRKSAPKTLAILANAVFDAKDSRVTGKPATIAPNLDPRGQIQQSDLKRAARSFQRHGWGSLPGTRIEADAILKLVPATEKLQAFDFDANYNWATSKQLAQYRFLHFATHGFADPKNPELSGIVLSLVDKQGLPTPQGYLQLGDIFNQDYPADLVVLSACETGLGPDVQGEGLVGLTRGLMYAGAQRVAVSLWSVDDNATAELMQEFYRQMLQLHKSPTTALRAAQLKLWQNPNTNKPEYWAAFTLQGEWR